MQTVVVPAATPAFVEQNQLGFVPFKSLIAALAAWETMHRAGETRPAAEVATLPVDQVALESATLLWSLLGKHGACDYFSPPAIGAAWPGQGGTYLGQGRDEDGTCFHLILADAVPDDRVDFDAGTAWATSVSADGHTDFRMPSKREAALLYANLADVIGRGVMWTSTQYSRGNAWSQDFVDGSQDNSDKSAQLRARAVRRFIH